MRRTVPIGVVLVAAAGWVAAGPAAAACHVAGFVDPVTTVAEEVGEAVVIVELRGRVGTCAGTVDVETADATATAGEDYEPVSRTLTFEEGDDRVETVELVVLDDDELESDEAFEVVLSNPTGGISGVGDPAVVTITDDEEEAAAGDADADGTDEPGPVDETVEDAPTAPGRSGGLQPVLALAALLAVAIAVGVQRSRS